MGKGSRHRSISKEFYDNYERIFGAKPLNNMEASQESQKTLHKISKENNEQCDWSLKDKQEMRLRESMGLD